VQVDDALIRDAIRAEIQQVVWPSSIMDTVTVNDGVVRLWGYVCSDNESRAARIVAERAALIGGSRFSVPVTGMRRPAWCPMP
jgi:osmotically-inducible protein OsmY